MRRVALLLALALLTAPCALALAEEEQGGATPERCPLQTPQHRARVLTPALQVATGAPGFIEMVVEPPPAADYYISTLASIRSAPEGAHPDFLPGYPRLRFSADTPGEYRLLLRITLVSKSSCGGVKARELAEEEVLIQVGE